MGRPGAGQTGLSDQRRHRALEQPHLLLQPGGRVERRRQAEVAQLDQRVLRPVGEQQVLRLDVAVRQAPAVQVLQRRRHLPQQQRGVALRVRAARADPVEDLAAAHQLEHQHPRPRQLEVVEEAHQVRVGAAPPHQPDLVRDGGLVGLLLVHELQRVPAAARAVGALADRREGASAQHVANAKGLELGGAVRGLVDRPVGLEQWLPVLARLHSPELGREEVGAAGEPRLIHARGTPPQK